jgi:hypothetical protein
MVDATPEAERGREPLAGLVERVTFHSAGTGFCVLRVKVRGHRDLITVLGSAAWVAELYLMRFKTTSAVPPPPEATGTVYFSSSPESVNGRF